MEGHAEFTLSSVEGSCPFRTLRKWTAATERGPPRRSSHVTVQGEAMKRKAYRVHGMMQSYFTRKMTGYLDYKGIPWLFRRFPGASPEATAAGYPGGMPVVETHEGEFMWDSTAMIHHLELRFPEPAVLPDDPVQRFLCYVIEDAADEWFYRPAVGSRWYFTENGRVGGF